MLYTAANVLLVLLSTVVLLRARQELEQARKWSARYTGLNTRVTQLEGANESLQAQHRKLSGRFYAYVADAESEDSETPGSPAVGPAPAGLRSPAPYCENFHLAQLGGPKSEAASCECAYCVEMRGRRAATKAELLPAARAATLATSRTRE